MTPRPRYLLDTNVLSEPAKRNPNTRVAERIRGNLLQIATASTAWNEFLFGYMNMPNSESRTRLERYLFRMLAPNISVLSYNRAAAEWHASERARLVALAGHHPTPMGRLPQLLASTA